MTPDVVISALFLSLAAVCYAFNTHWYFHGRKSTLPPFSFWGAESWNRKYKRGRWGNVAGVPAEPNKYYLVAAPDNWYYSLFRIDYREKFPLSATVLVFLTDGFHLVQWVFIKCLILAMVVRYEDRNGFVFYWGNAICLYALWLILFNVVYTRMKK